MIRTHGFFRLLLAVLIAAAVVAAPSQSVSAEEESMLQANMDNIVLEDFIKFIGRYTGRNIVYSANQIPSLKFSIYSQEALTEPQLMAIFRQVLESAKLAAVSREGMLYIVPTAAAKGAAGDLSRAGAEGSDEDLITTVYQLGGDIKAEDVQKLLQGFASDYGQVAAIPQARSILVTDTRERVRRMMDMLRTIENARPDWVFELIPLQSAVAESVVQTVSSMYSELSKRGRAAETPMLYPVTWSNSILFSGTPDQLAELRGIIGRLDDVDEENSNIRIFRLTNAKAASVAAVLRALVQTKEEDGKAVPQSAELKVSADVDTNAVIVVAGPEMLNQVEDIIKELDLPLNQVFIEALVIETSLTNSQQFGVEWFGAPAGDYNLGTISFLNTGSSGSRLASYADPIIGAEGAEPPDIGAIPGGFSIGYLGNIITYGGEKFPTLGALVDFSKTLSDFNILSTPQVMTLDNAEAEVFVGENRPFLTSTKFDANNNPVQTFDYKDVGIRLKVTPHINGESGLIRLDIEQTVDKVSQNSISSTQPVTLNRFTRTSVQIIDGATVVISGLVEETDDKGRTAVPGLANVPVFGWLFKRDNTSATKATIMMFLTARIVRTMEAAEALADAKLKEVQEARSKVDAMFETEFEFKKSLFMEDKERRERVEAQRESEGEQSVIDSKSKIKKPGVSDILGPPPADPEIVRPSGPGEGLSND